MTMKDLHNNIKVVTAITPLVITNNTASVSAIIDTQGYESLEFVIALGTMNDSDTTCAVLVEDGNDANLSDYAAVADEFLLGTETEAGFQYDDDGETRKIGYVGPKRYVRLTVTPSNNTGNIPLAALALLGHPNVAPVE